MGKSSIFYLAIFTFGTAVFAVSPQCNQIKQACLNAGFIQGDAKDGKGLWMDCVDPIMQGTVAKKSVIALPTVDAGVVAACKAKHPKFGAGKIGN